MQINAFDSFVLLVDFLLLEIVEEQFEVVVPNSRLHRSRFPQLYSLVPLWRSF